MPRKKHYKNPVADGIKLVGVFHGDDATYYWGPFDDIDQVIAWCEKNKAELHIIPLIDPSISPEDYR